MRKWLFTQARVFVINFSQVSQAACDQHQLWPSGKTQHPPCTFKLPRYLEY